MKVKKNALVFLVALVLSGVAVLSCSDGKLNLLLVFRTDRDEDDPVVFPPHVSSSATAKVSSSSVAAVSSSSEEPPPSSSSEEPPPPSSSEEPSSSSSEPSSSSVPSSSSSEPSSSSRGPRSSSSKTDKEGYTYEDYPTLEEGQPGVARAQPGGITRYWDGCKPSCSRAENLFQENGTRSPNGFARNCDRNGKEMPLYYRLNPVEPTWAEYIATPNACVPEMMQQWTQSEDYAKWASANPGFPSGAQSTAYICSDDQIPYAVNDTLAYAFVANTAGNCGKCFQVQFRSDWEYGAARPSHKAIAGKTLIVMVNNFGVGKDAFDIMIPGGGLGAFDAFSEQIGTTPANLGERMGGLLAECVFGSRNYPYSDPRGGLTPHERATLGESKDCLEAKCRRVFDEKKHPTLLKGCLWHVNWFEAVDNPEGFKTEVPCPQYLIDRYGSTMPLPTRPADLNSNAHCKIGGVLDCAAP